jgi:thioredoxin 2
MKDISAMLRCNKCGAVNRIPADKLTNKPKCGKCKNLLELTKTPVNSTSATFDQDVLRWPGAVLVEFWSTLCGHCLTLAPIIEEIARERAGLLKVVKVDINKESILADRYNIQATPLMLFFKNGNKLGDISGALPKQHLDAWIDSLLLV